MIYRRPIKFKGNTMSSYGYVCVFIMSLFLTVGCGASRDNNSSSLQGKTLINGKSVDLTTYKNAGTYVTYEESEAIWDYTREDYIHINPALRKASDIKKYSRKILNIASAINKLRGKKCKFYRYINDTPGLSNQMSKRGQVFLERGFFSASHQEYMDADDGLFDSRDIKIIGTSSRCASIGGHSSYPGENEVLFPPGTEFEVTKNMEKRDVRRKIIYLRELVK